LQNIKAKELKDRVKPEDYKPESSRKQKDDEYDQKQKEMDEAGIEDDTNYDPAAANDNSGME